MIDTSPEAELKYLRERAEYLQGLADLWITEAKVQEKRANAAVVAFARLKEEMRGLVERSEL